MKEQIFFDNNATTKIDDNVLKAMIESYERPLNPSSTHHFGRFANKVVNQSRLHIQNFFNAQNYKIIFTSGGTESNNLALLGFKDRSLIASAIEHPSVYNIVIKQNGGIIKVDNNGIVNIYDLEEKLKILESSNFIASVMLANNETGSIQAIKEIAKIVHKYGGLIHSDIVQAVGKINIDLEELNIDLASVSAHKINGPQGVGALLVKKSLDIDPIMFGGLGEGGKRAGTINVAGTVGFGEACRIAVNQISKYQELANLRDYLEQSILKIAEGNVVIFSKDVARLPNTSFFATKGVDNQTQLIDFDLNGISVSIGSACSSGSSKPSRVLGEMNVADDLAKNTIRVSFGRQNDKEQVDYFIKIWNKLYQKTK
jgi:cysteine desulfurase